MASVEEVMTWLKANYEHINTDLPGSVGEMAQNCSIELLLPNGRRQWVLVAVSIFRIDVNSPFAERTAISAEDALSLASSQAFGFREHPMFGILPPHYVLVQLLPMADVDSSEIIFAIEELAKAADALESKLGKDEI
jgi:hypothetical protein